MPPASVPSPLLFPFLFSPCLPSSTPPCPTPLQAPGSRPPPSAASLVFPHLLQAPGAGTGAAGAPNRAREASGRRGSRVGDHLARAAGERRPLVTGGSSSIPPCTPGDHRVSGVHSTTCYSVMEPRADHSDTMRADYYTNTTTTIGSRGQALPYTFLLSLVVS